MSDRSRCSATNQGKFHQVIFLFSIYEHYYYLLLVNTVILSTHTQTQLFSQLLRTGFCFLHRSTKVHQSAAGPGPVMESPSAV